MSPPLRQVAWEGKVKRFRRGDVLLAEGNTQFDGSAMCEEFDALLQLFDSRCRPVQNQTDPVRGSFDTMSPQGSRSLAAGWPIWPPVFDVLPKPVVLDLEGCVSSINGRQTRVTFGIHGFLHESKERPRAGMIDDIPIEGFVDQTGDSTGRWIKCKTVRG